VKTQWQRVLMQHTTVITNTKRLPMPGKFKPITLQEALPGLISTYYKGKLVPFTGSGISAPNIPVWNGIFERRVV
jgi:hypothetical protein